MEVQRTRELWNSSAFSEGLGGSLLGLEKEQKRLLLSELWRVELCGINVVYSELSIAQLPHSRCR